MKENALVLNEADKTLMYLVGCDEGEVTNFANMMSIKTLPGSTYLDKLNKGFYQKVAVEGKASDWVRLAGSKPTKCAVFAMAENTSYLGKRAVDLQDHIEIGADDKVTGNLKYVAKFVKFNETVKAEQSGALPVSVHSVVSGGRRAENAVGESPSGFQERKNVPARRERTASDRSYCRRNEVDQADSRNRF